MSDLLIEKYMAKTPRSRALYQRARETFPSGVTHDTRYLKPYPLSVARAQGGRKWDVDGCEYVDYFGGHGALILGHNHPEVTKAVREQLSRGDALRRVARVRTGMGRADYSDGAVRG